MLAGTGTPRRARQGRSSGWDATCAHPSSVPSGTPRRVAVSVGSADTSVVGRSPAARTAIAAATVVACPKLAPERVIVRVSGSFLSGVVRSSGQIPELAQLTMAIQVVRAEVVVLIIRGG